LKLLANYSKFGFVSVIFRVNSLYLLYFFGGNQIMKIQRFTLAISTFLLFANIIFAQENFNKFFIGTIEILIPYNELKGYWIKNDLF
jgi:hypothetical protein